MKYPECLFATFETSSLLGTQIPKKLLIPASCVDGSKRVTRALCHDR